MTRRATRQGATVVAIVVCLVVATLILTGLVSSSIRQRIQLRNELQLEQTYWLLDAGISKAIQLLDEELLDEELLDEELLDEELLDEGVANVEGLDEQNQVEFPVTIQVDGLGIDRSGTIKIMTTENEKGAGRILVSVVATVDGPNEYSTTTQRSQKFYYQKSRTD